MSEQRRIITEFTLKTIGFILWIFVGTFILIYVLLAFFHLETTALEEKQKKIEQLEYDVTLLKNACVGVSLTKEQK